MKIKPLDDRVLVQASEAEEVTAGGIVLPDAAKEKPQEGKIVAAGPGMLNEDGSRAKLAVSKGDTVIFGKYAGTEVKIDGKEYKIMREKDILAKINK